MSGTITPETPNAEKMVEIVWGDVYRIPRNGAMSAYYIRKNLTYDARLLLPDKRMADDGS